MPKRATASLTRRIVRDLHPYVPGEQLKVPGLIKLNTNENPYPPASNVLEAVKAATDERLRLYPNPTAQPLRDKIAKLHRCKPENIIVGNGSDELLAMAVRCFVEPASPRAGLSRSRVQYFNPSYSLYPVLARAHGAWLNAVPLPKDFGLPPLKALKQERWDFRAALTFITTPNAPSGRGYSTEELERICRAQHGVVVLDEAYVEFARENAMRLALKYRHVLVARTFSKAYSLCFQRVGYLVGHAGLIAGLDRIRDSYNVNGLGQIAALATLDNLAYYRANFREIISTRDKLTRELKALGFEVLPSQTNFILVKPPTLSAAQWMRQLRECKILVRWFEYPEVRDYLRITIGTPHEMGALLDAVRDIVRHHAC